MTRLPVLTLGLCLCLCLLALGCARLPRDTVFQTSTIDALLAGVYDGDLSCRQLREHGDFGIGTFDHLDGELVLLDGTFYQVLADGTVRQPDLATETPFATVCQFRPDQAFPLAAGADFAAVEKQVNAQAPNSNLFYAVKITGRFTQLRTRSVPRQSQPYPPLAEVAAHQPEFELSDVRGTIVGFRCPAFVKGVNVPGYHLHFLSQDRTQGGHILRFTLAEGSCEIARLPHYFLRLPAGDTTFAGTDLAQDRSGALKKVESGEGKAAPGHRP